MVDEAAIRQNIIDQLRSDTATKKARGDHWFHSDTAWFDFDHNPLSGINIPGTIAWQVNLWTHQRITVLQSQEKQERGQLIFETWLNSLSANEADDVLEHLHDRFNQR